MKPPKTLDLEQVIYRSAIQSIEDIAPLLKYLGYESGGKDLKSPETARDVAAHLRRAGSNDFATFFKRRGEGVPYNEVVLDVAQKYKAPGASAEQSVEHNESRIIEKMFADSLDAMSIAERRALFQSMNLNVVDLPLGSASTILVQQVIAQFGGFATYRIAEVIANMVSRALLGTGLGLATNAALTRTIGTLLGPVGWIATGAWLAVDLAGPAYRKTVPAVLYVALLRQVLMNRVTIGVVGGLSAGKDSLIQRVFKVADNINPIAESTAEAKSYPMGKTGTAFVINYPSVNDSHPGVNAKTDEMLNHTDIFLMVVDARGGISGGDQEMLSRVRRFDKPVLVCLNKWDLIAGNAESAKNTYSTARERLKVSDPDLIATAFRPEPPLGLSHLGRDEVLSWTFEKLRLIGKSAVADALVKDLK